MNPNSGLRRGVILALSIVVLMLSSGLAVATDAPVDGAPGSSPGEDIDYTKETIVVEHDSENGEIQMKLGESQMFVNYGDGQISFKTTQTKYLGIADLYDDQKGFERRVGIPVQTIFWQRLIGVGEYVDVNNNGLFDVQGPKAAGTFEELDDDHIDHEEMLKWIDFDDVEWSLTGWQQQQDGNEVDIQFVISASDIAYDSDSSANLNDSVSSIEYIFHVTTVEEEIYIEAVPHYRVIVDENAVSGDRIDYSEEVAKTNVTGHVLNSTWKYDQVIEGWDASTDSTGDEINDTRLVVLTEMAYGIHLLDDVGEWMKEEWGQLSPPRAIAGHGPDDLREGANSPETDYNGHPLRCGVDYVQPGSSTEARASEEPVMDNKTDEEQKKDKVQERIHEYMDTDCKQGGEELPVDDQSHPQAIRAGGIHFNDNSANLGRIRWVSNATVDGLETEVLFQLHGARPVLASDIKQNEGLWVGVRMVGGYNYVLGTSVYHDPEYSADILTIDTQSFDDPFVYSNVNFAKLMANLIQMMPMALGIVVLTTVAIAVASTRSRREQAPIPSQQQYVPAGAWASDDDWSQYQQ
jgi:hypothetical protein